MGRRPCRANDNPAQFWDFASSWDEGLILGENFESLNVGDDVSLGLLTGDLNGDSAFLANNDNADLTGNHLDGDSAGEGAWSGFTFDDSSADHGAPTTGTYYIEATSDHNIDEDATALLGHNFSLGVWNSAHNTQYNITHYGFDHPTQNNGWGWGFGPNEGAHSGPDVFDPTNPQRVINAVNIETGFALSYSFLAVDLRTGASWGHGGEAGVPNHIPGFATPTLRVFYDRRGGQNTDMDDFRIATVPWIPPLIPEPATFALLGLGSLLMLRRRV